MEDKVIAVVGLGYVGLPLSVEFGKNRSVVGYDTNAVRISQLNNDFDSTMECSSDELREAEHLTFTADLNDLKDCQLFIITVPTPIDQYKKPDLGPLEKASQAIGTILKPRDIVIYESTVYPGATEEVCVPILEHYSGLIFNRDFFCGYSPERINPGDKKHKLPTIVKVTSGSTALIADEIDDLYREIISAGTHRAPSIKVAEAAKVIENTQRDVNIALINELSLLFNKLEIDTESVLLAAGTKWNFLPFRPGLVGGHCIGVDPYYLTYKAAEVGFNPEMILAGRRLNDSMGAYVSGQVTKLMVKSRIHVGGAKILIMGFTFKEDCPDTRNTRVSDIVNEFSDMSCSVEIYDPWVNNEEVWADYGFNVIAEPSKGEYDAIVLAVAHSQFKALSEAEIRAYGKKKHVLYDIKYLLKSEEVDGRF